MLKRKLFLLLITGVSFINGFDWEYYVIKYNLHKSKIKDLHSAVKHYTTAGIPSGKKASKDQADFTNFNWQYYQKVNHLKFNGINSAINHYKTIGVNNNLNYCKRFSFLITLHIFNLDQLDEYIDKINHFMKINPLNNYNIKINIPIGNNIYAFNKYVDLNLSGINGLEFIKDKSPYHKHLITHANYIALYRIYDYISQKINIEQNKLQIMFSENRGVDVGGFLLMLDQAIKQNIQHDFVIKLHSKTSEPHRRLLTSFMNYKINALCDKFDAMYSIKVHFPKSKKTFLPSAGGDIDKTKMKKLLSDFDISLKSFSFSAGTMFLASSKVTDFFKKHNLLLLFNKLNSGYPQRGGQIEHAYERFFGYLIKKLNLKTFIADYMPFQDRDIFID